MRKLISVVFLIAMPNIAFANDQAHINDLMDGVNSLGSAAPQLSVVRKSILRESALTLGARAGRRAKNCAIHAEIERRQTGLNERFRFSELIMGKGLLPPVISSAENSVALTQKTIRWSSLVYTLDEPARLVVTAPTWRDWLYVGLHADQCTTGKTGASIASSIEGLQGPADANEEIYFKEILTNAFRAGEESAQSNFESNLARLERSYSGMRNYFDLFQRGIVSAPVIVTSTDIVNLDDPNILIIGDTLIRISIQPTFVHSPEKWIPLHHESAKSSRNGLSSQSGRTGMGRRGSDVEQLASFAAPSTFTRNESIQSETVPLDQTRASKSDLLTWEIRKEDRLLSAMLARWAASEAWSIDWRDVTDVEITSSGSIERKSFLEAANSVIEMLSSNGHPIVATVTQKYVLTISAQ